MLYDYFYLYPYTIEDLRLNDYVKTFKYFYQNLLGRGLDLSNHRCSKDWIKFI